jgi:NAD(P)-dependent dehydrogenase (short-subunit alcohol dehydrogenase family)
LTIVQWGSVGDEFAAQIRPFLQTSPLAAIREGVDTEELVKGAQKAGGRPAYEMEIAKLVVLLCSPDAGYTTGSVLSANGGMRFST